MDSIATAREGYSRTARQMRTARAIEYDVIARITAGLRAANRTSDFPSLAAAVHENRVLWSLLAADLSGPQNGLPRNLKEGLIALAGFTFAHGSKVLARTGAVDVLVEINTAVMNGLRAGEGRA